MEDAILLIDKPSGLTSFDVIRELRKRLGIKKIGHAGTLDPLATGLLVLGTGKCTKKLTEYTKLPKTYEADILLGVAYDTGDIDGAVIEEVAVPELSHKDIEAAVKALVGDNELPVPAYSAVQTGGERLYRRARRGEVVERPVRVMHVENADLTNVERDGEKYILSVTLDVASGVYIRSLAEALGEKLGYPATIQTLRRTRVGDFDIKDAKKLEDL